MSSETVGGYRLVRKLGEGVRAEVWLGHPERPESDIGPVAIKLYRAATTHAEIGTEAEALSRAAGDHCVALLDLTAASDGSAALVLGRCGAGDAGRLLATRAALDPGEAITLLAPLLGAVRHMHSVGVAHGGIRAGAVLLESTGSPRLACFGRGTLFDPGSSDASIEDQPGVAADLRQLAGLATSVLALVPGTRAAALADWLATDQLSRARALELHDRLFSLGEPAPIDLGREVDSFGVRRGVPGRVVLGAPVPDEPVLRRPRRTRVAPASSHARSLPVWAARLLPDAASELVGRALTSLAVVRVRYWLVAAVVSVALVAAGVLVPTTPSDAGGVSAQGAAGVGDGSAPGATGTPSSDEGEFPEVVSTEAVTGDDPVAALIALLEARELCIRDLSLLCLDAVGQQQSAALDADRALLRDAQAGGGLEATPVVVPGSGTTTERLGDSAIVQFSVTAGPGADAIPASVLLMKGEAGWRIRDYLTGDGPYFGTAPG